MKKATLLFSLYFFHLLFISAQTEELQPLLNALKTSEENTEKVDLLVQLGEKLLKTDAKQAQAYAEKALKLSKKLAYQIGKYKASLIIGKAHLKRNEPRKSIEPLEEALDWAEQNKDIPLQLDLYQDLAQAHQRLKESAQVEVYRQKYRNLIQQQNQQAADLENQKKMKSLEDQFLAQKDSASLARLTALQAQAATDAALDLVSEKEAALLRQSLELANLEKKAAQIEQEKTNSQLLLEREQQRVKQQRQQFYWVITGGIMLIVVGLGAWFYYQSRQAQKLAKMEHLEAERLRILTAGIAHEIKNPLNFVNNFAEGSVEISDELEEAILTQEKYLQPEQFSLLNSLVGELKQNSVDIKKNGQRVNQIVRSMADYAAGEKGELKPVALHPLIDENINLAYHGYRGQHPDFIANIERKYDPRLSTIDLIPTYLGQVLLNIINNACDALYQKQRALGANFTPTLTITTLTQNGEAVIRLRDNGTGIPAELRDKIFTPFFTTKPTGSGNTGLGLSISHEIIVRDHKGKLQVESEPGVFTEFIITLPKTNRIL